MTTYLNSYNIEIKVYMIENSNTAGITHNCLIPKNSATTVKYPLILSRTLDWPISHISFNNFLGLD